MNLDKNSNVIVFQPKYHHSVEEHPEYKGFVECRVCGLMYAHPDPRECSYEEMACPDHRSTLSNRVDPKYACNLRLKELGLLNEE